MPSHYELSAEDTFSIPANCIAKVYERTQFMGHFTATYKYAQRQARKRLKEAMLTFVWLETLPENENLLILSPKTVAKELGVSLGTVHNHLAKAREVGLLVPDDRTSDYRTAVVWRICPFCSWRGTGKNMAKYVSALPGDHPFFQYLDPDFLAEINKAAAKDKAPAGYPDGELE